ncbi:MAG TPA: hypothetical protein VKU60_13705 [Chloroflexota bacterium]|nr:hypothetical protein [Chloroflexota bacterium]
MRRKPELCGERQVEPAKGGIQQCETTQPGALLGEHQETEDGQRQVQEVVANDVADGKGGHP